MHSKDRTMLAAFGFRDPDKHDRRHDLACQYIARRDVAARLVGGSPTEGNFSAYFEQEVRRMNDGRRWGLVKPLIGFIDLLVCFGESASAVEVKISPVTVGDIIRQISFYRQSDDERGDYAMVELRHGPLILHDVPFVVVTAFSLSTDDVAMLKNERISHAFLGGGFENFIATSTAENQRADSQEI